MEVLQGESRALVDTGGDPLFPEMTDTENGGARGLAPPRQPFLCLGYLGPGSLATKMRIFYLKCLGRGSDQPYHLQEALCLVEMV